MSRFKIKRDPLDALFSEFIRARDGNRCRKCGRGAGESIATSSSNHVPARIECSHIFSRRHQTTRLDPDNAIALCHYHHRWWHENPIDAGNWIRELLGEDFIDRLRFKAFSTGHKLQPYERDLKRAELKQMIEDLEMF